MGRKVKRIPSRDVNKVRFYLFTKSNPENYEEIKFADYDSVKKSHFDFQKPTKFIVHGYNDRPLTDWILKVKV